jgi:ketosteroid isomerase-like protein
VRSQKPTLGREILLNVSQENVEIVRQAFRAFDRRDRAAFARLLAPDVEWHTLAGPILGVGTVRGRDGMLKFLWEDIPESIEGFRATPEEFTDLGDDRVLLVGRFEGRGRISGVDVDLRVASVYEIRGGMVTTVRDYARREQALEAAGLGD